MITRKFGRRLDHRVSLIRNLATSLILYERVTTTAAKAKEVKGVVERLINVGKEGNLSSYRRLRGFLFDPKAARKVMEDLAPRYREVTGGYVTLTPLAPRSGDGAPRALVQLRALQPIVSEETVGAETGRKTAQKKSAPRTRRQSATKAGAVHTKRTREARRKR